LEVACTKSNFGWDSAPEQELTALPQTLQSVGVLGVYVPFPSEAVPLSSGARECGDFIIRRLIYEPHDHVVHGDERIGLETAWDGVFYYGVL